MQAAESGYAGDYHEYTLDHTVDLASGTLLRAALFAEQSLPCQRQYLFEGSRLRANPGMVPITERSYGTEAPTPVRSTLAFKSDRALPAGTLRFLQNASDGVPEFIGEDTLGHTPRGQAVTAALGNSFDLRGERKRTDFQFDKDHRTPERIVCHPRQQRRQRRRSVIREIPIAGRSGHPAIVIKYEKRSADTINSLPTCPPAAVLK
jgi:hypothetical protein